MSKQTIEVKGLSKSYRIKQERVQARHYMTFRDELASTILHIGSRLSERFRKNNSPTSSTTEEFWALKDIDFSISEGEVIGFIGRNGAGKSTLLKILSRITEPTRGRAILRGRVSSLLEVGTGFHPELTGRENIFLNGAILGMKRQEVRRKFDEIVEFAEVQKFLDTPVKRYSSGMYVRLAFAVAAHLEPEILIVDEVLAVGDASFQQKCLGKIKQVSQSSGRTVLFVSHNMSVIQDICDRVILLENGTIAAQGESTSIVTQYMAGQAINGKVLLRDWKDRETNGQASISEFVLLSEEGKATNTIRLGDNLRWSMKVQFHERLSHPLFGLLVSSRDGEHLLDIRSCHGESLPSCDRGTYTIEATANNVCLYPGEYILSPWIYDDSSRSDVDWVKNCSVLRILDSNGPQGDLRLHQGWGKYFLPSVWTVTRA